MSVPAAASTAEMFLSTRSVWAETSPSISLLVTGSRAVCPAQKTNSPALIACEYGPMGGGASLAVTTVRPDGGADFWLVAAESSARIASSARTEAEILFMSVLLGEHLI